MSNEQALEFSAGEHWIVAVTYLDGDGNPINLTGALAIEWAISTSKFNNPAHTASLGNAEIAVVDAAAGRADISVPPASQSSLPPGVYYHESRVTNATGVVSVQFHGSLAVASSILN